MATGGPEPHLVLEFPHKDWQLELLCPLFSFLFPKFSLASFELGHFLLSQLHEIVVQLDEPSRHDTHPVVTRANLPNQWNPGKVRRQKITKI